jgi:hypothetical protein
MLTSMEVYKLDCMHIMNSVFNHDDSYTDRTEGGVLDVSYNATKTLWKSVYGTEYVVPGGMYRDEPPKEYFSPRWNPGKPSRPRRWAELSGRASDGNRAFIMTWQERYVIETLPHKEKYVLGRIDSTSGYYHIETREAHRILLMRVKAHIHKVIGDITTAQCFCRSTATISKYERYLVTLDEATALLNERLSARAPVGTTKTKRVAESAVYSQDGVWLYPVALYDCAGGACGGVVVSSGGGTYFFTTAGEVICIHCFLKMIQHHLNFFHISM